MRYPRRKSTADGNRWMAARWPGKCSACGCAIAKGDQVHWSRTGGVSRTVCESCGRDKPTSSPIAAVTEQYAGQSTGGAGLRALPDAGTDCCILGGDGVYRADIAGGVTGILALAGRAGFAATGGANSYNAGLADARMADERMNSWFNNQTLASLAAALSDPGATITGAISTMADELAGVARLPSRRGRRMVRRLDCGDDLTDAAELLAGNPDCWQETRRVNRPRRRVRIGVNVSILARGEARELLYRGAAAVALTDWYQSQGVAVELVLYSTAVGTLENEPRREMTVRAVIKQFDAPLDVGALALATADIGFFRRAVLGCRMRLAPSNVNTGLGRTSNIPAADAACLDVIIDADILTESAAIAAIRRVTGQAVAA